MSRHRRGARAVVALGAAGTLMFTLPLTISASSAALATTPRATLSHLTASRALLNRCPWIAESQHHSRTSGILADQVVARMTLSELTNFVVLRQQGPVENINVGVPRLCIPALTLIDGPNGVGANLVKVTQFPSEISLAATFNPVVAQTVGFAMAQEARSKGFNVLQAPDLNLVRSPLSGRAFETYGEDPFLASVMGVAVIEGIQTTGVMAQAKHLGAYTQENARARLNQVVSARVMTEIYNAPFQAAVQQGHVASMMCAMGLVNGVNTCSTPSLYATLRGWGFHGFVRSDYAAVEAPAPAFKAGMDLIKPATAQQLSTLVSRGQLATPALRHAVQHVLTSMFAFGLITTHTRALTLKATATSAKHQNVALQAARQSIVLLQNKDLVLPLKASLSSLAVVGVDAYDSVTTRGGGSSGVHASSLTTPLAALRAQFSHTLISYSPGGLPGLEFDPLNAAEITGGTAPPAELPIVVPVEPGTGDVAIDYAKGVTAAALTATTPGKGEGWSSWDVTFVAKNSGTYVIGLENIGDTWLAINGTTVLADRGIHGPYPQSTSMKLVAGHSYKVVARWFTATANATPRFGIDFVQPQIDAAVAAAKKARVAVVFAGNLLTEGADMPSLPLQGDLNALISAVATVNPRTVVVLNTGGPVLTPWRSHVAAIVEAWYPGEQGAQAIAQVLSGVVDATGRLPITMPTSDALTPAATVTQFPGQLGVVKFEGLNSLGYRWYQSQAVTPAFPFGFGLSYASFSCSQFHAQRAGTGVEVSLNLRNTGSRSGTDVIQVYVAFPGALGEAPEQLRGIAREALAAGTSQHVVVTLSSSAFTYDNGHAMVLASGKYTVSVATSSAHMVASQTLRLK